MYELRSLQAAWRVWIRDSLPSDPIPFRRPLKMFLKQKQGNA
jgi:hypothetical protein